MYVPLFGARSNGNPQEESQSESADGERTRASNAAKLFSRALRNTPPHVALLHRGMRRCDEMGKAFTRVSRFGSVRL